MLKRASYRDAVDFIAQNDEPDETDLKNIGCLATAVLVASIFGTTTEKIAGMSSGFVRS